MNQNGKYSRNSYFRQFYASSRYILAAFRSNTFHARYIFFFKSSQEFALRSSQTNSKVTSVCHQVTLIGAKVYRRKGNELSWLSLLFYCEY